MTEVEFNEHTQRTFYQYYLGPWNEQACKEPRRSSKRTINYNVETNAGWNFAPTRGTRHWYSFGCRMSSVKQFYCKKIDMKSTFPHDILRQLILTNRLKELRYPWDFLPTVEISVKLRLFLTLFGTYPAFWFYSGQYRPCRDNFCHHRAQEGKLCRFCRHTNGTVWERVITFMQFWLCLMFSHELYKINIAEVTGSLIFPKTRVLPLHSVVHVSPHLKRWVSALASI